MTDLERRVACAISPMQYEQFPQEFAPEARRALLAIADWIEEERGGPYEVGVTAAVIRHHISNS